MKKFATLSTLLTLLSCFLSTSSFPRWEGISAEAAVSVPQQPASDCNDDKPMTDLTPGRITTPKGMEIGEVQDFVLDLEAGRIAYTARVFNQIGGLDNRVFVLPWSMVKVNLETNTFTLSEDKAVLETAPSFSLDTWLTLSASQWADTVTAYWQEKLGRNSAAVPAPGRVLSKASELVGVTIKDPAGEDVGTIEELLLDPETGSIAYAVLSSKDIANSNRTVFFALPWEMVQVNPVQHTFVVDVNKALLTESRHVAREKSGHDPSAETLGEGHTPSQK